jgi:hypothetical protein
MVFSLDGANARPPLLRTDKMRQPQNKYVRGFKANFSTAG